MATESLNQGASSGWSVGKRSGGAATRRVGHGSTWRSALVKLALMVAVLCPSSLKAACHVVTPAGSGDHSGSDWNNAMNGLPATLTRGDTYYLADGTYPPYDFTTTGTALITIKKAISSDNCTNTNWNATTMGSGQATFSSTGGAGCYNFRIAQGVIAGNLTIDGQIGSGETAGSYGIKMPLSTVQSQCTNGPYNVILGQGGSAPNVTIRYVEFPGSCAAVAEDANYRTNCDAISNTPKSDEEFRIVNTSNLLLEHNYWHNGAGTPISLIGGAGGGTTSSTTVQYNFMRLATNYTSTQHSNIIDLHGGNSGLFFRWNVVHDVEGSGGITSLNSGSSVTDRDVEVYGNVLYQTNGNPFARLGWGNGLAACINLNTCPGWKVYNNTVVNFTRGGGNGPYGCQSPCPSGTTADVKNNLYYNVTGNGFYGTPSSAVMTEDHNSALNSGSSFTGANDVIDASPLNPFVSWTTGNFNLASQSTDWNNWVSLASPYNLDLTGATRTASRGAYEYGSGSGSPPPSPPSVPPVPQMTLGALQ